MRKNNKVNIEQLIYPEQAALRPARISNDGMPTWSAAHRFVLKMKTGIAEGLLMAY